MFLPENIASTLREVVKDAVERHTDVDPQIEDAFAAFRSTVTEEMLDDLVRAVVQEAVYARRSEVTYQSKRDAGAFGPPSRLKVASSPDVANVSRSILDTWSVAGRCLGDIKGSELASLADSEDKIGKGHLLNADLLRHLAKRVKGESKVRDCVRPSLVEAFLRRRGEQAA
jgi:hypothetical protein